MRIVNKRKFARGIILVTLVVAGITQTLHNDWKDEYTTTEVYVQRGDTLWSIAENYVPDNVDIREYIYEVRKLNNMASANINAGDIITVYERGEK